MSEEQQLNLLDDAKEILKDDNKSAQERFDHAEKLLAAIADGLGHNLDHQTYIDTMLALYEKAAETGWHKEKMTAGDVYARDMDIPVLDSEKVLSTYNPYKAIKYYLQIIQKESETTEFPEDAEKALAFIKLQYDQVEQRFPYKSHRTLYDGIKKNKIQIKEEDRDLELHFEPNYKKEVVAVLMEKDHLNVRGGQDPNSVIVSSQVSLKLQYLQLISLKPSVEDFIKQDKPGLLGTIGKKLNLFSKTDKKQDKLESKKSNGSTPTADKVLEERERKESSKDE